MDKTQIGSGYKVVPEGMNKKKKDHANAWVHKKQMHTINEEKKTT